MTAIHQFLPIPICVVQCLLMHSGHMQCVSQGSQHAWNSRHPCASHVVDSLVDPGPGGMYCNGELLHPAPAPSLHIQVVLLNMFLNQCPIYYSKTATAAPGAARAVAAALPIRLAAPPAAADVPCTAAPTALPPKHHTFSHSTSRHSTAAVAAIRGPCQNNAAQRHAGSMGTLGTALKTPPALHMGVPTHDGNMATIPGSYLEHGHRAFVVST
eukprot:CAMPEP_0202914886 /NCGR_PEP_ID=MMETSP1392-20130828/64276_1 /ASSEMBLY_ACC=CAM_ASM_000868 /TAXON_ID=225041 /ORGANISM="Chlamydomonas chlamydogama, Strain SAG 11-48b" /LENGTH=212 /DNA_ID=CAMNT_0049606713 /DNA_START=240 /DNA_END=879 /DNA_ORIENTATION=+